MSTHNICFHKEIRKILCIIFFLFLYENISCLDLCLFIYFNNSVVLPDDVSTNCWMSNSIDFDCFVASDVSLHCLLMLVFT